MKVFLKLTILFVLALFLLFNPGSRNIKQRTRMPLFSFRSNPSYKNEIITAPPGFPERRRNASPAEMEEMRRQMNNSKIANTQWIKESTKKYSPVSWYMLMQYEGLPESTEIPMAGGGVITTQKAAGTFHYLRGRTRIDLLASMETNVHEIAHGYFDQNSYRYLRESKLQMTPGNAQGYVYISPSESFFISFPMKSLFPSGELSAVIPSDLRTYRYETYIGGSTSTQTEGVIGLLNELDAYYLGSKYCFDMLEPYKVAAGSDAAGLFEWVTHTQSTMSAFFEIEFFMKEYLLYMKKKHISDFNLLISCRPFGEAYGTLTRQYKDLIEKYQERIDNEIMRLNSTGNAGARMEKGWLWVKAGNSNVSSGTPVFSKEKEILEPVIGGRRYREIEEDFPEK